jgi:hypothetical protein
MFSFILEKVLFYFCYRNEIDEQIDDLFSSDREKEHLTERSNLENEKQLSSLETKITWEKNLEQKKFFVRFFLFNFYQDLLFLFKFKLNYLLDEEILVLNMFLLLKIIELKVKYD